MSEQQKQIDDGVTSYPFFLSRDGDRTVCILGPQTYVAVRSLEPDDIVLMLNKAYELGKQQAFGDLARYARKQSEVI